MKQILIARRYATAAVNSLSPQQYTETLEQIKALRLLMAQNPEVKRIMASAIITKQKKVEFVKNILAPTIEAGGGRGGESFWQSVLTVLILKNRGNILETFLTELRSMLDEKLNQHTVNITLAHNQDTDTLNKIKSEVEKTLNSKITYDLQIDKDIIGGFIATTESHLIDASVRSNLRRFANEIRIKG